MSDGLRVPEGSKFLSMNIAETFDGPFQISMWVKLPGETKEYSVSITRPTLKEALLEAGKFLDEGLGLDIQLQVKMPI